MENNISFQELIIEATKVAHVLTFNTYNRNYSGRVGCALLADNGKIYTGVSIDLVCGLGNCAEYSAIAQMVKDRETVIKMIVSVYEGKDIIPPCGRCRELIAQLDTHNYETQVIIQNNICVPLSELLPSKWIKVKDV